MEVYGYAVKRKHDTITIVANDTDGTQMELAFWGGDVFDLAHMLLEQHREFNKEQVAEAEWEAELDRKVDAYYTGAKETENELKYMDAGHDFDPPSGE